MTIISLLPLSSKFILQYMFCDNGHNSFKNISPSQCAQCCFLSWGHWRDIAGERSSLACPEVALLVCSMGVRAAPATQLECVISWHPGNLGSGLPSSCCSYFNTDSACCRTSAYVRASHSSAHLPQGLRALSPKALVMPSPCQYCGPPTQTSCTPELLLTLMPLLPLYACVPGHWLWPTCAPFVPWRITFLLPRNGWWALGQANPWISLPSSGLQPHLL